MSDTPAAQSAQGAKTKHAGSAKRARRKNKTHSFALGGDDRDRTDDLKLAKLPLSQLSYAPVRYLGSGIRDQQTPDTRCLIPDTWWAREDSNFRPHAYQARALTN